MDIEEALRHALRVEEPSPDFTRAVMDRVAGQTPVRRARWRMPLALAAAVLVAAVGLGILQQQREAQRLQSARQLAIALEITSSQLNQAQQRLSRRQNRENGI
jgi:anti-sigma-K factor RskA